MRKILITVLSIGLSYSSQAQFSKISSEDNLPVKPVPNSAKVTPIDAEFIGFRNPASDDQIWQPMLSWVSKNESENDEALERIKEEKNKLKQAAMSQQNGNNVLNKTTATPPSPVIAFSFDGIDNGGGNTPLDNTIAISDKDTIIAMVNSQLAYYTSTGVNFYNKGIYTLIGDGTLSNSMCDPKIIWDNVARRYIFYTQTCDAVSANSKIVLGFSKTSNPMNGWYFYKFTGNPLSNGMWWDYPKLAVSSDEVFVTGNLFSDPGNNFSQSVIMQIQKAPCLAGTTPLTHVWSGMTGAFSILPVGYGQSGSYGPGIWAVSSGGAVSGATAVNVFRITNNIASGTASLLTYNVPVTAYSTAGDANQNGSTIKLNTGDSRAMDGFFLKGTMHFVHNIDVGSGFCGFRYYRINLTTLTAGSATFSGSGTDVCYPALASASNDSTDNSVVISYEESSPSIYPRTCVVACDKVGAWSLPVVVKAGVSYIDYGSGPTERWGDYTGMCKRFGDPARTLWMAGMYGGSLHYWRQYIAKIAPKNVGVPGVEPEQYTAQVFPNPIVDRYSVRFEVAERQNVIINITDMQGRTVVELYNGVVEPGENVFSFNKESLTNGIYSLNIVGAKTNIKNEKIVVAGK